MATIYIDNLIRPKQVNSPTNYPAKETKLDEYIYSDLHLDLIINKSIGNGLNTVDGNDIVADYDAKAIRNSLYNIFTTRKGQKLLSPTFGASLEQYLFNSVDPIKAKILGNDIVNAIETFEPRVEVIGVQVTPIPELSQYYLILQYRILNIGKVDKIELNFEASSISML